MNDQPAPQQHDCGPLCEAHGDPKLTNVLPLDRDKYERILTHMRVWQAHMHEAHPTDAELPLFRLDDDAFVLSCDGCDWAWSEVGEENADEGVRWVPVELS